MTKLEKRLIGLFLSMVMIFSTIFSAGLTARAAEVETPITEEAVVEENIIEDEIVIPETEVAVPNEGVQSEENSQKELGQVGVLPKEDAIPKEDVPMDNGVLGEQNNSTYDEMTKNSYSETTYEWKKAKGQVTCTAKRTNLNNPSDVQTETAIASDVTYMHNVKCGDEILDWYDAEFEANWATKQTKSYNTGIFKEHCILNGPAYYEYDESNHWNKCIYCDYSLEKEPHDFTEWSVGKEPTNKEPGIKERKCKICNYIEKVEIPIDKDVKESSEFIYKETNNNEVQILKYVGKDEIVNIPEEINSKKVTKISNAAFSNSNIISVKIPKSITEIQYCAFYNCGKLNDVKISTNSELKSIGNLAFSNTAITGFSIPDSVKEVGEYAFNGCENLTHATIGKGLSTISKGMFSSTKLGKIEIPNNITRIEGSAFSGTVLNDTVIPSSVIYIGDRAFYYTSISSPVVLSNSLIYLGEGAFTGCKELKSIKLGNGLSEIKDSCFAYTSIQSIDIPKSVKKIGKFAFEYCENLVDVTIENSDVEMDIYAFSNTGVSNLDLGNNVSALGLGAFENSKNLKSLVIPESVTAIEYSCFESCSNLNKITFPKSLKRIERNVFNDTAWLNAQPDGEVYINDILYLYKGKTLESGEYVIKDGTISIGGSAFKNQYNITSLVIPESVEIISNHAFLNCDSLKSVYIPSTVKSIGVEAFGYNGEEFKCRKYDDFTIIGDYGSEAERYAKSEGITFVPLEWSDTVYEWFKDETGWHCTATRKCITIPDKVATLNAKVTEKIVDSACEEDGKVVYTATFAEDWAVEQTKEEAIKATGHNWGKWFVEKAATNTKEGLEVRICSLCNKKEERTIAKISGTWKSNSKGWWYEYSKGSYAKNEFMTIGGQTYYFGSDGYMVTGWKKLDGKWYVFNESGVMFHDCWYQGTYYLDSNGAMLTNTETPDHYYVDGSGKWIKQGWQSNSKGWWYVEKLSYIQSEFKTIDGKTYYFDSNGYMATGWKKIDNKWYVFNESGVMLHDCWYQGTYYLDSNGVMLTNIETPDHYYVDGSGKWIKQGWQSNSKGWWYVEKFSYIQSEFKTIDGKIYYFDSNGYMVTGWKKIDNKWYVFNESGVMLHDCWYQGTYYLDSNGVMLTDTYTPDGYYVDAEGKWDKKSNK